MTATAPLYWDASAVLSLLFEDENNEVALRHAHQPGIHILSSLAWAETHSAIGRIEREGKLAGVLINASRESLADGPWHLLELVPEWGVVRELAAKCRLRGGDLWHLATAKTLQIDLPQIELLTFDQRLHAAAQGAGLA